MTAVGENPPTAFPCPIPPRQREWRFQHQDEDPFENEDVIWAWRTVDDPQASQEDLDTAEMIIGSVGHRVIPIEDLEP